MTNEEIVVKLTENRQRIGSLEHRMNDCEEQQKIINNLANSVDRLASNMENMLKEQERQSQRLSTLEQKPLTDYNYYKRTIASTIISGVLGAVLGAVLALIL